MSDGTFCCVCLEKVKDPVKHCIKYREVLCRKCARNPELAVLKMRVKGALNMHALSKDAARHLEIDRW